MTALQPEVYTVSNRCVAARLPVEQMGGTVQDLESTEKSIMNVTNPQFVGWAAIIGGLIAIAGFISLILFFVVGGPFGTLNDISSVPVALLLLPLVLALYRLNVVDHSVLSLIAAVAGGVGFILTATGSVLLVLGQIDFEQSLLPAIGGLGLIGIWLLLNTVMGLTDHTLPKALASTGLLLALPLMAALATVFRLDSITDLLTGLAGQSPTAGYLGPFTYLLVGLAFISYMSLPLWFIGAGRAILTGSLGSPISQALAQ